MPDFIPNENNRLTKIHAKCLEGLNDPLIDLQDRTAELYKPVINNLRTNLDQALGLLRETLPNLRRLLNHADPDCSICRGTSQADGSGHRKDCVVSRITAVLQSQRTNPND